MKLVIVESSFSWRKRVVELRVVVLSEVLGLIIDHQFNLEFGEHIVDFLFVEISELEVIDVLPVELV